MEQLHERLGDQKGAGMLKPTRRASVEGFSLIELMVTITLFAILVGLSLPSMSAWIRNNKIRTVADSLQNGLRTAQTESLRRSRQVVFSLTNSTAPETSLTAVANGSNWSINAVKLLTDDSTALFIEKGVLTAVGSGVEITGPAALCFSSIGRLVANTNTGVTNGNCAAITGPQSYNVSLPDADRPLRVMVTLGGQVRLCDPARSQATQPDGCP